MITLAFDSTAKVASVAVCEDKKLLLLYNIDNGLTQSELLLPMAENALASLHLSFSDIDLLACTVGPGSFTGVRIGTALVKGIAFGKNIPCISISTLEALAENARGLRGIIVPVMDARRAQVYTALFSSDENELKRLTEDNAISLSNLAETLKKYSGKPIYLVGDGYEISRKFLTEAGIKTEFTPPLLLSENAYSSARLAFDKFKNNDYKTDCELRPTYLRMPQAERERLERLNSTNKES